MRYLECGCCGHYHKENYGGDCRNDAERYTYDGLKKLGITDENIIDIEPKWDIASI